MLHSRAGHYAPRVNCDFRRVRIGSDESPAAEKYSAEVSGDNQNAVGQLFFLQDIECRHSRRALRLAVIRKAADVALSDYICRDIVRRVPVL